MTTGKVVVLLKYQRVGNYKKTIILFITSSQSCNMWENNVAFCEYQLSAIG